jgi:hypothetical protein
VLKAIGEFLSEYYLGDIASVFGLLVALVGFAVTVFNRVDLLSVDMGREVPYLFPDFRKGKPQGKRVLDFRKAWKSACMKAMLEGLEGEERQKREAELKANPHQGLLKSLRHDFRRTAVRNMVNRGVPERVAMKITGHRTRTVFDRYHIVSPTDLQEAARKIAGGNSTLLANQPEKTKGVALATP